MDRCAIRDGVCVTRAADDDEFDLLDDFCPAMPSSNFRERICADEKEEPVSGMEGGADSLNGVDGVTSFQTGFETGGFERMLAGAGELYHVKAVLVGFAGAMEFVRRLGGGNHQDFVERAAVASGPGYG